jgi:hypothetical protein
MPFLQIGELLYGFCGGYFGRDSYGTKRVEAVGIDWVVAREEGSGEVVLATPTDSDIEGFHDHLRQLSDRDKEYLSRKGNLK